MAVKEMIISGAENVYPVHLWKAQVQQDDVGRIIAHGLEPRLAEAGQAHGVALAAEDGAVDVLARLVVFDQDDPWGRQGWVREETGRWRAVPGVT